jgi:hypothetical protein
MNNIGRGKKWESINTKGPNNVASSIAKQRSKAKKKGAPEY